MPENETPAERLRTAAARVRVNHGFGVLVDEFGRTCALGAILGLTDRSYAETYRREAVAASSLLRQDEVAASAAQSLREQIDMLDEKPHFLLSDADMITHWNDRYVSGGNDVANAMEKAAARWEETHG